MQWSLFRLLACFWLVGSVLAANRNAIRAFKKVDRMKAKMEERRAQRAVEYSENIAAVHPKIKAPSRFATEATKKFAVDGSAIPDVDFDIGESYAGLLPISDHPEESRKLYFWFFPTANPLGTDEIVIWFNGGPGCSSLSGMLTENGPFLWQEGTLAPTPNSYSWTNLTNVMFIEQPVGVGFTQGTPNITNEVELGLQFIGFYKQFVDTFGAHGSKVYLTGESYAGYYIPYVADAFITANDTNYYNLAGVGINDPILGDSTMQEQMVLPPFIEYWSNLLYFSDRFLKSIRTIADRCNFTSYMDKYFTFPPPAGPFPDIPDYDYSCDLFSIIWDEALAINPCFNIYHITEMCPHTYSQLGIVNQGEYSPPGQVIYFNRTDVQAAINAPVGTDWAQCTTGEVFVNGDDNSYGPAQNGVLQRVIEYTNNTLIGVGNLDFLLCPNGTLFALQNMTWNGQQGFQTYPQENNFFVPFHPEFNGGRLSESGFVGNWGEERGLVFYTVQLAGHELPGFTAGAGYRMLEKLLGRVSSLSERSAFTTQSKEYAALIAGQDTKGRGYDGQIVMDEL